MNYRFEISLPNSSDFRCEIAMNGEQTFQQFHDKIVEALHYDSSQMASFFALDRLGNREQEIALMDMAMEEGEAKTLIMSDTRICDIVKPGCLELEYVFDFFTDRYFKVEYAGEYTGNAGDQLPVCVYCEGEIPQQFSYDEESGSWDFEKPEEEYDGDYDDSFMDEFDNGGYDDKGQEDDYYDDGDYRGRRYESLDDYIDKI